MSKAVLVSIRPKWCELIASGEKTIEVRKTAPKIETPFKCYIYCTKPYFPHEDFFVFDAGTDKAKAFYGGGKVIGEFVCDRIIEWHYIPDPDESADPGSMAYDVLTVDGEKTGLEYDEFEDYGKGDPLFGWHISDLVIYDEPIQLRSFMKKPCDFAATCGACRHAKWLGGISFDGCDFEMTHPPQNWCYVEELG